jgi:hypothetical protein
MAAKVPLPALFAAYCVPLIACAGCVLLVNRAIAASDTPTIDRN